MPHERPDATPVTVAAVPSAINPPATAAPIPSQNLLDAVLAGPLSVPAEAINTLPTVIASHPLEGIEDVEAARPVIANLLVAEREAGGKRIYPRSLLRQQHIVAYMLVNPFATTTEICAFFGIGPGTLANISKSDTFKALINAHKVSIESSLGQDLQEQLRQTLAVSMEVVQKAVTTNQDPEFSLAVMDKAANRLGMGAKHNTNVQINNNIVTPDMIAAARARRLPNAS